MTDTELAAPFGVIETLVDGLRADLAAAQTDLANARASAAAIEAADHETILTLQLKRTTLFGLDGQPLDVGRFPRVAYCREYTPPGRGLHLIAAPTGVLPHISFKDTPTAALVNPWLDKLTRPCLLEWNHEPEHDMTTAVYRAGVQTLLGLVAAHPNGQHVSVTQTFTRYAQVHGQTMTDGQSASWNNLWVPGSKVIGFDCEQDSSIKGYPDPTTFFQPAVDAAKALGVPFVIPELGWPQQATDMDASGLAAFYVASAAYLRSVGCMAVAAFNQQGTTGDYQLATRPAALAAWQAVVGSQ